MIVLIVYLQARRMIFVAANKSRPVWAKLAPLPTTRTHLVAVEGAGHVAVEAAFSHQPELLARTTMLVVAGQECDPSMADRLRGLGADGLHVLPTRETGLVRLRALLSRARMGTCLYLAGPEAFLDAAAALAGEFGVTGDGLQTELCGGAARRVQCVHCKGMMEDVALSIVSCEHCGVHLTVRDHFSRRLGAYQGVCANAETPGVLPEATRIDA